MDIRNGVSRQAGAPAWAAAAGWLGLVACLPGLVGLALRDGTVYTGDDLDVYHRFQAGRQAPWPSVLTDANQDMRFRPVTDIAMRYGFQLVGTELEYFRVVNVIGLVLVAVLAGLLTLRLTERLLAASAVTFLLMVVRFVDYNVATAYGIMENLSLLFFLTMLAFCLELVRSAGRRLWLVGANASLVALVLTHERFISAAAIVTVAALLGPGPASLRAARTALPFALVAAILLYRGVFLSSPLFVRRADARPLSVSPEELLSRFSDQVLNLFGLNIGPDYLVGENFGDFGTALRAAALATLFLTTVALAVVLRQVLLRSGTPIAKQAAVLAVAVLAPLAGPLTTDVADPRFLAAPYVALLLLLALPLRDEWSLRAALVSVPLVLLSVISNVAVLPGIQARAYWNYSNGFAASAAERLRNYTPHEVNEVWFVTGGSNLPKVWYFYGDTFFRLYGAPASRTIYVTDASEIPEAVWRSGGSVVFAEGGLIVTDLKARRREVLVGPPTG